jgi:hypothetical protein
MQNGPVSEAGCRIMAFYSPSRLSRIYENELEFKREIELASSCEKSICPAINIYNSSTDKHMDLVTVPRI